jgi:hypothetical protein
MNIETSVKIPETDNQVLMIADKEGMVQLFNARLIEVAESVTLGKLAGVDDFYDTRAGRIEWENIRNKKAGYLPYRRACLALGKLINDKEIK